MNSPDLYHLWCKVTASRDWMPGEITVGIEPLFVEDFTFGVDGSKPVLSNTKYTYEFRAICPHGYIFYEKIYEGMIQEAYDTATIMSVILDTFQGKCLNVHHSYSLAPKEDPPPDPNESLSKIFPGINLLLAYPCVCDFPTPRALWVVIIHMNDKHKWDRDHIATWLESLPIDLTMQAAQAGD